MSDIQFAPTYNVSELEINGSGWIIMYTTEQQDNGYDGEDGRTIEYWDEPVFEGLSKSDDADSAEDMLYSLGVEDDIPVDANADWVELNYLPILENFLKNN